MAAENTDRTPTKEESVPEKKEDKSYAEKVNDALEDLVRLLPAYFRSYLAATFHPHWATNDAAISGENAVSVRPLVFLCLCTFAALIIFDTTLEAIGSSSIESNMRGEARRVIKHLGGQPMGLVSIVTKATPIVLVVYYAARVAKRLLRSSSPAPIEPLRSLCFIYGSFLVNLAVLFALTPAFAWIGDRVAEINGVEGFDSLDYLAAAVITPITLLLLLCQWSVLYLFIKRYGGFRKVGGWIRGLPFELISSLAVLIAFAIPLIYSAFAESDFLAIENHVDMDCSSGENCIVEARIVIRNASNYYYHFYANPAIDFHDKGDDWLFGNRDDIYPATVSSTQGTVPIITVGPQSSVPLTLKYVAGKQFELLSGPHSIRFKEFPSKKELDVYWDATEEFY